MTDKQIALIGVAISAAALIVSILAIVISQSNGKQAVTDVAIESFDEKWQPGTFSCVKLLLDLAPEQKILAYSGKEFLADINLRDDVVTCKPEYELEITNKNKEVRVPAKVTNAIKTTVQKSFNALDILVSKVDRIDRCDAWVSIKDIIKRSETRKLITEWQKYGDCGTSCFHTIENFIDKGGTQNLSAACE